MEVDFVSDFLVDYATHELCNHYYDLVDEATTSDMKVKVWNTGKTTIRHMLSGSYGQSTCDKVLPIIEQEHGSTTGGHPVLPKDYQRKFSGHEHGTAVRGVGWPSLAYALGTSSSFHVSVDEGNSNENKHGNVEAGSSAHDPSLAAKPPAAGNNTK